MRVQCPPIVSAKKTLTQVSQTTLNRLKEIKKDSGGVTLGKLADLGLAFFYSAYKSGEVVIQNGEVIPATEEAK